MSDDDKWTPPDIRVFKDESIPEMFRFEAEYPVVNFHAKPAEWQIKAYRGIYAFNTKDTWVIEMLQVDDADAPRHARPVFVNVAGLETQQNPVRKEIAAQYLELVKDFVTIPAMIGNGSLASACVIVDAKLVRPRLHEKETLTLKDKVLCLRPEFGDLVTGEFQMGRLIEDYGEWTWFGYTADLRK